MQKNPKKSNYFTYKFIFTIKKYIFSIQNRVDSDRSMKLFEFKISLFHTKVMAKTAENSMMPKSALFPNYQTYQFQNFIAQF